MSIGRGREEQRGGEERNLERSHEAELTKGPENAQHYILCSDCLFRDNSRGRGVNQGKNRGLEGVVNCFHEFCSQQHLDGMEKETSKRYALSLRPLVDLLIFHASG